LEAVFIEGGSDVVP